MRTFALCALPLLSALLIANHNGFDNNAGHLRVTDYADRFSYTEGYENFIFAVPDNNISAGEARTHRLDTGKHHPTLRELKQGRSKQTKEDRTSHHWNGYAV
ncbi:hypothetical protein QU24_15635 [Pantoea rodasii]|uniref:Uncharacterized protein n=1 Tax=Pantoea rodasii TaxID=1076549 RepID=A0A0B1R3G0_9GAMM|nr:hypothetical protein [Pantoea rodasii]KHJ67139.1 hypothetical protein QU24_15635 [Pantoea rodasii]